MSTQVLSPFPLFTTISGAALNLGHVYIGVANQDPETNPQQAYWDEGLTVPASQPLLTSGGYIVNAGNAATIYAANAFSIRVRDKNGVQVFYRASVIDSDGLRRELTAAAGAGLVGYSPSATYPFNTVGAHIQHNKPYDATHDILRDRAAGQTNDAITLNTILANYDAVTYSPDIGTMNVATSVLAYLPNTKIIAQGGLQAIPWVRASSHTGSTLICGQPTGSGAGSLVLENLWFTHTGRQGATPGVPLNNLLTGGQSHIEIHGGQHATLRVGGYGMPHFATAYGGAGVIFEKPFIYGGVWDPNFAQAQESISQIRFAYSATHGHGTNHRVLQPHMYGSKSLTTRSLVVGSHTVTVVSIIGPKYGVLVESSEDFEIVGGFSAQYSTANIGIIVVANGILQNGKILGTNLDESTEAAVYIDRSNSAWEPLDGLLLKNNYMNGQFVGKSGLVVTGSTSNRPVKRLRMEGNITRAHLAAPVRIGGVDGGAVKDNRFAGYNSAVNDTSVGDSNIGAGCLLDGGTRNVEINDNVFGGGANGDTETNSVGPNGTSTNATQWAIIDTTTAANNTNKGNRVLNFGLPGGGFSLGQAVAPVAISVGASPYTYTAGDQPETIYLRGGTVSSVTQGGVAVFVATPCTVQLAPYESMVVTYTVAPTAYKKVL